MLSIHDSNILSNYRFVGDELSQTRENRKQNDKLLCIRNNQLDLVESKDVTCWEIFKSYFGVGKLAGCTVHLSSISKYLEKQDISSLSRDNPAYQTIHAIAARMLVYEKAGSKVPTLWEKLQLETRRYSVTFHQHTHYFLQSGDGRGHEFSKDNVSSLGISLPITPLCKVGHLKALALLVVRNEWWRDIVEFKVRRYSNLNQEVVPDTTPVDETLARELTFEGRLRAREASSFHYEMLRY